MMSISLNTTVSQIKDIVATDIDGDVVMMSIENGAYYGLDPIGSRIWEMIGTPCKVSDLIERLMEEFEVDRPTCEKGVFNFLNDIQKFKLIQIQHR